jgi:hypothetical protein
VKRFIKHTKKQKQNSPTNNAKRGITAHS